MSRAFPTSTVPTAERGRVRLRPYARTAPLALPGHPAGCLLTTRTLRGLPPEPTALGDPLTV